MDTFPQSRELLYMFPGIREMMRLAASRYFLPVSRAILLPPQRERPMEMFDRLGIPKSPGYRVLAFYQAHNALQNGPDGLLVDSRKVVNLAGGLRADRAVPDRILSQGPPLETATGYLNKVGLPYALGLQSAANQHAYFESGSVHQIYLHPTRPVRHEPTSIAKKILPSSIPDVMEALTSHPLASKNNRYEFFIDDLAPLDIIGTGRMPLTGPVQTVLDLALHARTAAHLEFLMEFLRKQEVMRD